MLSLTVLKSLRTKASRKIVPSLCGSRSTSHHVASIVWSRPVNHLVLESCANRSGRNINIMYSIPSSTVCSSVVSGMAPSPKDNLVVVVLGSTASGKSKLAIDLAKHVGGEIISADSMQVYDGLDILTNKATDEEMQGIPHHMISIVDRAEKFDIVKFKDRALPLVEDILSQGKVPFIVGGTNYYIESLLWKVLIGEVRSTADTTHPVDADSSDCNSQQLPKKPKYDSSSSLTDVAPAAASPPVLLFMKERRGEFTEPEVTAKWSQRELHQALKEVDPVRALKFHPNDTRKIVRSLQVFFRTGRKHSDLIEEQCPLSSEDDGENSDAKTVKAPKSLGTMLGGPLRFPNSICLWIQADRKILNARIEDRVDQMVGRGLKDELDRYVDRARQENRTWDFEEGQLQSIGVKEFQSYIELSPEERETELGQQLFNEGLDRLKIVTRQYAKRQMQWVSQRFLKSSRRQLPRVYGLDGNLTDSESWNTNVTSPALQILNAHLKNQLDLPLLQEKLLPPIDEKDVDFIARRCEICDKTLLGSLQYDEHMKSAKHWKVVKRKKKHEETKSPALLKEVAQ